MTYPLSQEWSYRSHRSGHEFTNGLALVYELSGDPISDNYTPDEIDASDLFDVWTRWLHDNYPNETEVKIHWFVTTPEMRGTFESAPFDVHDPDDDHFLTHFTWPVAVDAGDPLNFLRLPVLDEAWNENGASKGGFIQEATGWKPAALQPYVSLEALTKAVYPG